MLQKKLSWLYFFLLIFLLTDTTFSFFQFYNTPLDGDMAESVVPNPHFDKLFSSPFGTDAILGQEKYPNPNRFFMQWPYRKYMLHMPVFLQQFADPVSSVYMAAAIAKTGIQLGLIILLSLAVTGARSLFRTDFMVVAFAISCLFQTNGFRSYMGIIDPALTYTFSYAFPMLFVLVFFLPLIRKYYHKQSISQSWVTWIGFVFVAVAMCLSGPLNPGIVLVAGTVAILGTWSRFYVQSNSAAGVQRITKAMGQIPKGYGLWFVPAGLLSFYSLYLGTYNQHNELYQITTAELYQRLPVGLLNLLTGKPAFIFLFAFLIINAVIIKKVIRKETSVLGMYKWLGLFALLFMLLLPLGGYRDYRPNVIRYDTFMPVTLGLFFMFGTTTLYILRNLEGKMKYWYTPLFVLVLFIFANADRAGFDKNDCERAALVELSKANQSPVLLNQQCNIMSWNPTHNPAESELNARLLEIWNVTEGRVLYSVKTD